MEQLQSQVMEVFDIYDSSDRDQGTYCFQKLWQYQDFEQIL